MLPARADRDIERVLGRRGAEQLDIAGAEAADGVGIEEDLPHRPQHQVGDLVAAALGAGLTVGEDAAFGRNGSVPVNLINPQPDLQALHGQLVAAVDGIGGRILTPAHTLAVDHGLRPLLVELGASVPTKGLYVIDAQHSDPEPYDAWFATAQHALPALPAPSTPSSPTSQAVPA